VPVVSVVVVVVGGDVVVVVPPRTEAAPPFVFVVVLGARAGKLRSARREKLGHDHARAAPDMRHAVALILAKARVAVVGPPVGGVRLSPKALQHASQHAVDFPGGILVTIMEGDSSDDDGSCMSACYNAAGADETVAVTGKGSRR